MAIVHNGAEFILTCTTLLCTMVPMVPEQSLGPSPLKRPTFPSILIICFAEHWNQKRTNHRLEVVTAEFWKYPSIHLPPLIWGWVAGAAAWAGKPRLPSPQPLHPALPGWSQASRGIVLLACLGSSQGPPTGGTCPKHLTKEGSGRHLNLMPESPHLTPLVAEEQRLYSTLLSDGRVSNPISKGEPSHPTV